MLCFLLKRGLICNSLDLATFFPGNGTTVFSSSALIFIAVIMDASGVDEVADGQNVHSSNDCPSMSRDERSNGDSFPYYVTFTNALFLYIYNDLVFTHLKNELNSDYFAENNDVEEEGLFNHSKTLTNKQRGNEVTARPATLDGEY